MTTDTLLNDKVQRLEERLREVESELFHLKLSFDTTRTLALGSLPIVAVWMFVLIDVARR